MTDASAHRCGWIPFLLARLGDLAIALIRHLNTSPICLGY